MHIYSKGECVKTYIISLGKNPTGDKKFEGDKKTPEGKYFIYNKNPNSECYKNLGISYPSKQDMEEAKRLGKKVGGSIKIHGLLNGKGWIGKFHRFQDWTAGCIAVTNEEMEELYQIIEVGTPIIIKP
jgi:murein L,D-transpeptidase YafK